MPATKTAAAGVAVKIASAAKTGSVQKPLAALRPRTPWTTVGLWMVAAAVAGGNSSR